MNKHSRKKRSVVAWEVHRKGRLIDLVFGKKFTANQVKQSLVEHDGYPPDIVIKPIYPETAEK